MADETTESAQTLAYVPGEKMSSVAVMLYIVAAGLIMFAIFFPTDVENFFNLGRLQTQSMLMNVGLVCVLVATTFYCAGKIIGWISAPEVMRARYDAAGTTGAGRTYEGPKPIEVIHRH